MAQRCKVCTHPKRDTINRELLKATSSLAQVAEAYGMSTSALDRHKANHLKVSTGLMSEAKNALTIVEYASDLHARSIRIADSAEALLASIQPGDMPSRSVQAAAAALRELRGSIELLAKLVVSAPPEDRGTENSWLDDALTQAVSALAMPTLPGQAPALEAGIEDAIILQAPE